MIKNWLKSIKKWVELVLVVLVLVLEVVLKIDSSLIKNVLKN